MLIYPSADVPCHICRKKVEKKVLLTADVHIVFENAYDSQAIHSDRRSDEGKSIICVPLLVVECNSFVWNRFCVWFNCIYVMFYMRGIALLCCSKLMVTAMMSFYIMCIPMQVFVLWVGMWVGESLKNTLILCSLNDCFAVLYWRVVQHWLCLSSFSSRCPFIIAGLLSIEPS